MTCRPTLQRIISVLSVAATALSCTDSILPEENLSDIRMELVAGFADTRTANDGMSTFWTAGDRINLIHSPAGGGEYISETFTYRDGNTFDGTVRGAQSVNDWYAFYPCSGQNVDPSAFSFTVEPCQLQDGNNSKAHLSGPGFPLFGMNRDVTLSSSLELTMANVLSVADFHIVNGYTSPITIRSIEFSSSAQIAGPFVGDFTGPQPQFTAEAGSGRTVTLAIRDGISIAPHSGADFFAGLLPHCVSSGSVLSVRITATVDGRDVSCLITKTLSGETYFKAGAVKTLNLGFSADYKWQDATFNLENNQVSRYLDAAEKEYTDENYKTGFLGWGTSVVDNYLQILSANNRLDVPSPVSLLWNTDGTGAGTVQVFRDITMSQMEMQTASSGSSAKIWNLIPGLRYWYKVLSQDGALLSGGTFTTEGRRRMIKVSDKFNENHANNFRDLGGMRTVDGKTLKYGRLYRGTNVDEATQQEKDYMRGYLNVALDVELRTYGSSNLGNDIDFVNGCYTGSIEEFYTENENGRFKEIFSKIVEHLVNDEASYIHCKSGADRTGYVCILLEAALGVSPKDCSIDYELTSFSISGPHLRNDNILMPLGRKGLSYISGKEGSTFQQKAWTVLKGYGIPEEQIRTFCNEMLE